jgi:hypothetical protein
MGNFFFIENEEEEKEKAKRKIVGRKDNKEF